MTSGFDGSSSQRTSGHLSLLLGHTKTGDILAELTAVDSISCTDGLDPDEVTLRCSIPVSHNDLAGLNARGRTNPATCFIALAYADKILWAGPIWGRRYSARSGMLDLAATGMMSIFDRRWCSNDPNASPVSTASDINISNSNLRAIAEALIAAGMLSPNATYGDGALPVVLAPASGVVHPASRTYFGYELATIGERLRQLSNVIDGPDIHFAPRWRDLSRDGIEWVFRIGDPGLGQAGAPYVWEAGINLRDVNTDEDGSRMASLVMVPGDGSDRDRVIGRATRTSLQANGWPYLFQTVRDHSSTKEQATADEYAAEYARAMHVSIETWSATVDAFEFPTIGHWLVGDECRIVVPNDPWLGGSDFLRRIIGWTYNGGDTVNLKLSPTQGQV